MSPLFPPSLTRLRVVLCHDWLTGMRGGERVLELLCRAFPEAPIYTLLHNPRAVSATINRHAVHTSFLQRVPGIFRHYRLFLPLFPAAISRFRPPPADLLISTSHCAAKAIRPAAGTPHLCYCFTPMRYAWRFRDEYLGGHPLKRAAAAPVLRALREWDRATARRVDRFVAISEHVRARIRESYGVDADVVYPHVDLDRFPPPDAGAPAGGAFDLIVSALVPYKRLDLAVHAYARCGRPLKIAGTGTEERRLRALAPPNVELLGWRSDEEIAALYRACRLLVFPGEEDFGIVPLEAMACGKPVVALRRGGVTETVRDGETGVFFDEQTEESLLAAVETAGGIAWNARRLRAAAERFGATAFAAGLTRSIERLLAARR